MFIWGLPSQCSYFGDSHEKLFDWDCGDIIISHVTSVEFLPFWIDIFHVKNILKQNTSHFRPQRQPRLQSAIRTKQPAENKNQHSFMIYKYSGSYQA